MLLERFPGFQGHDPGALLDLDLFLEEQGVSGPDRQNARLVVTGDLTAYGTAPQFGKAAAFLDGRAALAGVAGAGIHVGATDRAVIAGNHDHWPGSLVFTDTLTTAFTGFFDPHPSASALVPLSEGWGLRLLRIDTTQDASRVQRALAQGRCVNQIKTLRLDLDRLPSQGHKEVRVLLLHHSPSYQVGRPHRLELDADSRDALHHLVHDYRVDALLSGHTHRPSITTASYGGRDVLDAVCGTSAQRTVAGGRIWPFRRQPPNTAVVHTLDPRPDRLIWNASTFVRTLGTFERAVDGQVSNPSAQLILTPHPH